MTKLPVAPFIIDSTNLSAAWGQVVLQIVDNPGTELSPLLLSISGFDITGSVTEHPDIRAAADALLRDLGYFDIDTIAFTIFPERYWQLAGGDRDTLFSLYKSAFPRLQAMNRKKNGRGLYFERLTMFGRGPCDGNQLEWILSQHQRGGVRRSMLQATTFDPERDHVASAQLGFPCLQHVSFVPSRSGLIVNAFYATQQLLDKAYGNYLGLVHLAAFMAHEMGLPLARLNVYVGVAKLERISKRDPRLHPLLAKLRNCCEGPHTASRQPHALSAAAFA